MFQQGTHEEMLITQRCPQLQPIGMKIVHLKMHDPAYMDRIRNPEKRFEMVSCRNSAIPTFRHLFWRSGLTALSVGTACPLWRSLTLGCSSRRTVRVPCVTVMLQSGFLMSQVGQGRDVNSQACGIEIDEWDPWQMPEVFEC